jgi:hypothetical protein
LLTNPASWRDFFNLCTNNTMNDTQHKITLTSLPVSVALLISCLGGGLATLGFAPFNLWPLGIIGLTVFALLLKTQPLKSVMWRSFAFGVGFYAAGIHWVYVSIHNFGGASPLFAGFLVLLFVCFLAAVFTLPFYIFGRWLSTHALSLIIALPACWLLGEWLRTWLLTGFPWLFIGYGHLNTWLAGWAPVGGKRPDRGAALHRGAHSGLPRARGGTVPGRRRQRGAPGCRSGRSARAAHGVRAWAGAELHAPFRHPRERQQLIR